MTTVKVCGITNPGNACVAARIARSPDKANLERLGYSMWGGRFEAVVNTTESTRRELKALCERHRVEHLALFGSALRDDFDPEKSDLDFSVEFSPMSREGHAAAYFGLLEDLEGVFGRRVDLVEIGAVHNPYLRRSIEEEQETAYAAT